MAGSSMRDIKRRIRSVTSIEHITNAMKLVSAAKLRRARIAYEQTHENLHYISDRIYEFIGVADEVPDRYILGGREIRRTCYIVVTSNRGLAGSYNTNIIKLAELEIAADAEKGKEKPLLVCIGGKGNAYFSKRGHEILSACTDPLEGISYRTAAEMAAPVFDLFAEGSVDEAVIISTEFKSTLEQHAETRRLLPFDPDDARGSQGDKPYGPDRHSQVEYEPTPEEVLAWLVSKYAEIMMYQSITAAATCEHAARRLAMQNATDNAREMIDSLELSFNRARQAAITSEITEIVSGADAIK